MLYSAGMTDELLTRVGARVKARRAELNLPVRELAARSGLSPRFLADVESGRTNIAIGRLASVAAALEVSLESLISPPMPRGPREAIDQLLRGMDGDDLHAALRLLETSLGRQKVRVVGLLGIRGAGKSTVGALAAAALGLPFLELDEHIEGEAGLAVREIFAMHGPEYYRRLEAKCFSDLVASRAPSVVALPGGIVGNPAAFDLIRSSCHSVWISAQPEQHWERVNLQGDTRLNDDRAGAIVQIGEMLEARGPLYRQADTVIDSSALTAEEVATEVVLSLERRG
ncbi:MAG: helix-turn-helix domain-containing protein [Proteobacteria bacterium]|nr:helix-turn-helix domain-containing protein [Pseudomonadota bacterium]